MNKKNKIMNYKKIIVCIFMIACSWSFTSITKHPDISPELQKQIQLLQLKAMLQHQEPADEDTEAKEKELVMLLLTLLEMDREDRLNNAHENELIETFVNNGIISPDKLGDKSLNFKGLVTCLLEKQSEIATPNYVKKIQLHDWPLTSVLANLSKLMRGEISQENSVTITAKDSEREVGHIHINFHARGAAETTSSRLHPAYHRFVKCLRKLPPKLYTHSKGHIQGDVSTKCVTHGCWADGSIDINTGDLISIIQQYEMLKHTDPKAMETATERFFAYRAQVRTAAPETSIDDDDGSVDDADESTLRDFEEELKQMLQEGIDKVQDELQGDRASSK